MKTEKNELAFSSEHLLRPRLTKREYFSAMAMQGLLHDYTPSKELSEKAVMAADLLMSELNKEDLGSEAAKEFKPLEEGKGFHISVNGVGTNVINEPICPKCNRKNITVAVFPYKLKNEEDAIITKMCCSECGFIFYKG